MTALEELKKHGHIHGYVPESDEEAGFLEFYDPSMYPITTVTVDVVALHRKPGKGWKVLLIERGNWPYKGHWALPGGFIDATETARAAAARELAEETHWEILPEELTVLEPATDPHRDPRGRVVSFPFLYAVESAQKFLVKAGDDAAKAQWFKVKDLPSLAFDHTTVVQDALRMANTFFDGNDTDSKSV